MISYRLFSIGCLLFRFVYIGIQIFIIFCALLLSNHADAARHKEFGTQNNIYMSDWARLKHQAELGDPEALFILGNYYYQPPKGTNLRKNLKKSAEFYFKAGIRGNASAQYNFALMLHQGIGVKKSVIESYAWFKLASTNSSPVAKHINQVSGKAAAAIEEQLDAETLEQAKQKFDFYTNIIDNKNYRKAKFPG